MKSEHRDLAKVVLCILHDLALCTCFQNRMCECTQCVSEAPGAARGGHLCLHLWAWQKICHIWGRICLLWLQQSTGLTRKNCRAQFWHRGCGSSLPVWGMSQEDIWNNPVPDSGQGSAVHRWVLLSHNVRGPVWVLALKVGRDLRTESPICHLTAWP